MNNKWKVLGTMIVLAGMALLPLAQADEWSKETSVTLNEAVAIPGQVLQPGTYVFKLADNIADRRVVQIYNESKSHLVATLMTIPAYRNEPTFDAVFTFEETPDGSPQAIHNWYFARENYGVGFVYR